MNTIYFNEVSLTNIIIFFCIYSFLGWITEVVYAFYNHKHFVNRGFLYGPFCPIYGSGIVLIILCLNGYKNNLPLLFLLGMLLTSTLEYFTGFILEKSFNTKWWDYSDEPLNLHGRICLSFSALWGLAALFIVCLVHPLINKFISLIPLAFSRILSIAIILYFITDLSLTILSLIKFNTLIEQISLAKEEFTKKAAYLRSATIEIKNTATEDIEDQAKIIKSSYDDLIVKIKSNHLRLLKAFPGITSTKDISLLKEIKEKLQNIKQSKK